MELVSLLFSILEILLFAYLAMATAYVFIYSLGSHFYAKKHRPEPSRIRKIAVLIPGYKEDAVIVEVAKQALKQDYPPDKFEVIVIADSFKPETLDALRQLPIRVVEVVFEISKKSKALNKCMKVIGDDYDIAMILDADNVVAPKVLHIINQCFEEGYIAVQGHRTAKNTNTPFAILDSVSEEINNSIFRKGHRALGLSSALIGSGMGIDYSLFKKTMATIDSVGEDKEVEIKLLKQNYTIEYADDAWVFDEKTAHSHVFVNQRRRWIAAQLVYFKDYFFSGVYHLFRYGKVDYFDKVLQMIQPPRILLSGILFMLSLLSLLSLVFDFRLSHELFALGFNYWVSLFAITAISLLLAVPKRLYTKKTFHALLYLPLGFILMILSLLRIKGASKKFIHTTHSHTDNSPT